MSHDAEFARRGRRLALLIAGIGLGWVLVQIIGAEMGVSLRVLALFDLVALAGFVFALWLGYGLWHDRRGEERQDTRK